MGLPRARIKARGAPNWGKMTIGVSTFLFSLRRPETALPLIHARETKRVHLEEASSVQDVEACIKKRQLYPDGCREVNYSPRSLDHYRNQYFPPADP